MSESTSFRAIADTNRRIILDLLRDEGPLRAGDLVARLPHISQPAVSKHLRILRESKLVRAEKIGREQLYHLEPMNLSPIAAWLAHYEPLWEQRLATLKELVESEETEEITLSKQREEHIDESSNDPQDN
ncbi:MAG: metalloregulator ArsR/SmtB family transcription factor [Chloroflexota bacterium]